MRVLERSTWRELSFREIYMERELSFREIYMERELNIMQGNLVRRSPRTDLWGTHTSDSSLPVVSQ